VFGGRDLVIYSDVARNSKLEGIVKRLFAVLTLSALGSLGAFAAELTGYISDDQCARSGSKAKTAAEWIQPAAFEACAQKCVKAGSAAVFVTEDNKILKIDSASKDKITPHLGHKVTVKGKVNGDTLTVDSIASLKM
jgi:hypothetical protein